MKNAKRLLSFFLILALNSSCAVFAMGRRQACDSTPIPERPLAEICITNERGGAICFDPHTNQNIERAKLINYECTNPADGAAQEIWISDVLKACRGP